MALTLLQLAAQVADLQAQLEVLKVGADTPPQTLPPDQVVVPPA